VKPPLVLLDANVIIEAYELGVWQALIVSFTLTVPSVVARHEAKYFVVRGKYNPIDLSSLVTQGKIKVLEADVPEIADLMSQFDPLFSESIDPGEQEALALMLANRCPDHRFCSADARPVQALAMLDMSDRGVSFEELLKRIGRAQKLDDHFTQAFLERQIKEGQRRRIQGDGLSATSRFRI
jgi:hypothetical protein